MSRSNHRKETGFYQPKPSFNLSPLTPREIPRKDEGAEHLKKLNDKSMEKFGAGFDSLTREQRGAVKNEMLSFQDRLDKTARSWFNLPYSWLSDKHKEEVQNHVQVISG